MLALSIFVLLFCQYWSLNNDENSEFELTDAPLEETMVQFTERSKIVQDKIWESSLSTSEKLVKSRQLDEQIMIQGKQKAMKAVNNVVDVVLESISTLTIGDVMQAWAGFSLEKAVKACDDHVNELKREMEHNEKQKEL